jgi:hypothetical protein
MNRGVTQLLMQEAEAAHLTLSNALAHEKERAGSIYRAAGYCILGLACRRTKGEAEAIQRFHEAMDTQSNSIYAHSAKQALKERQ